MKYCHCDECTAPDPPEQKEDTMAFCKHGAVDYCDLCLAQAGVTVERSKVEILEAENIRLRADLAARDQLLVRAERIIRALSAGLPPEKHGEYSTASVCSSWLIDYRRSLDSPVARKEGT